MSSLQTAQPKRSTALRTDAKARLVRLDMLVGVSSVAGALVAMPLARHGNSPEAAATLALAGMALLAGWRWAWGLIAVAQLLLLSALFALVPDTDATAFESALAAVSGVLLVPGLFSMRRGAAALVLVLGRQRNILACRRAYGLLRAALVIAVVLPAGMACV
jgi:hypothetical protein